MIAPATVMTKTTAKENQTAQAPTIAAATAARMLPFLLSVQFHPERLLARHPEHRAIFTAFARACSSNRKIKI